ncbi:MAG: hypothetical protein ACC726_07075 [Chloroflexota bacterium]
MLTALLTAAVAWAVDAPLAEVDAAGSLGVLLDAAVFFGAALVGSLGVSFSGPDIGSFPPVVIVSAESTGFEPAATA